MGRLTSSVATEGPNASPSRYLAAVARGEASASLKPNASRQDEMEEGEEGE